MYLGRRSNSEGTRFWRWSDICHTRAYMHKTIQMENRRAVHERRTPVEAIQSSPRTRAVRFAARCTKFQMRVLMADISHDARRGQSERAQKESVSRECLTRVKHPRNRACAGRMLNWTLNRWLAWKPPRTLVRI